MKTTTNRIFSMVVAVGLATSAYFAGKYHERMRIASHLEQTAKEDFGRAKQQLKGTQYDISDHYADSLPTRLVDDLFFQHELNGVYHLAQGHARMEALGCVKSKAYCQYRPGMYVSFVGLP